MDARLGAIITGVFCLAATWPKGITEKDFRGSIAPAVISNYRGSPAYGALEDSRSIFKSETELSAASMVAMSPLVSGKRNQEGKLYLVKAAQTQDRRSLVGLVVSSRNSPDRLAEVLASIEATDMPTEPTVAELASVLVRNEIVERGPARDGGKIADGKADKKEIPTAGGGAIVISVGGGGMSATPSAKAQKSNLPSGPEVSRQYKSVGPRKPDQVIAGLNAASSFQPTKAPSRDLILAAALPAKATQPGKRIGGSVMLVEGAALTNRDESIWVSHVEDGQVLQAVEVDPRNGRFSLDIDRVSGEISAELRNRDGRTIAGGRLDLAGLPQSLLIQNKIENLSIELRPKFDGVEGTIVSAGAMAGRQFHVSGAKAYVADLEMQIPLANDGRSYREPNIVVGSTMMVWAERDNSVPTSVFVRAGEAFELRLFTKSLTKALKSLTEKIATSPKDFEKLGLIWGRVLRGNSTVSNARVSLVGSSEVLPVYFSGFIPDRTAIGTTGSGEYAFPAVEDGEQVVSVEHEGRKYWPAMVLAQRESVTQADLNLLPSRNVQFLSYLALTGEPLSCQAGPLGAEETFEINETGTSLVQINTVDGLTFVEAESTSDFAPLRVPVAGPATEVHLPFVAKKWLKDLAGKFNEDRVALVSAVGFVRGDDFEVVVGDGTTNPEARVVYFDKDGKENKEFGPNGGGYVIDGLPRGLHTISILSRQTNRITTQLIYVDEYAVNTNRISLTF